MKTFNLPDLGEGLQEAELVSWEIKEGQDVETGQPLVSVETDKAVVEIPSPETGRVVKLFGAPGDLVKVGAPLVTFDLPDAGARQGVVGQIQVEETIQRRTPIAAPSGVKASPAVRALARRLGVELSDVTPTGPDGAIISADVESASPRPGASPQVARAEPKVDVGANVFSGGTPLRGVRRAMAKRMAQTHSEVVPVVVIEDADIEAWGADQDPTIRLARAIVAASEAEPALNAWYNSAAESVVRHSYVDLGMAVDTEDGLFVPVLRTIASRNDADLRRGLEAMKAAIHGRSIPPEELRGATITLSNFGMIAGRYASPVVVAPQVAILSAGRIRREVVAANDGPAIHRVMPLSLTFDHRVVTGGEAARFLKVLVEHLGRAKV